MQVQEHTVKRGDGKTLRWNLSRDLSGVSSARVIICRSVGASPVVDRAGNVDSPATAGVVSLALTPADYGTGLLEVGNVYLVEVETLPGPLTHPEEGYGILRVVSDLG
jgi:hypothetical protein